MQKLLEIRKLLKSKATVKAKESIQKFVSTEEKIYGVRTPILNSLATRFKDSGFELVEDLWQSSSYEEKMLAIKILGKICKNNPEKSLKLIKKFSKEIENWAICDTLATQGIRGIAKIKQREILALSQDLIKSKNLWQRRFALVLLINFKDDKKLKRKIKEIINLAKNDQEYYVQKAIKWLKIQ